MRNRDRGTLPSEPVLHRHGWEDDVVQIRDGHILQWCFMRVFMRVLHVGSGRCVHDGA